MIVWAAQVTWRQTVLMTPYQHSARNFTIMNLAGVTNRSVDFRNRWVDRQFNSAEEAWDYIKREFSEGQEVELQLHVRKESSFKCIFE